MNSGAHRKASQGDYRFKAVAGRNTSRGTGSVSEQASIAQEHVAAIESSCPE